MEKCDDYWCEHYGKGSGACGECSKKESEKDRPDFRTLLQQRAYKQMNVDGGQGAEKSRGQDR